MISFDEFIREQPCYWNNDQKCTGGNYCDSCEHQPADEDKENGKKEPVHITWQNDYGMIMPYCPICGEMAYSTDRCKFCGQRFIQEEHPENKRTITGGSLEDDGSLTCDKCGCRDLELFAHADGADCYIYTYRCVRCGSHINVETQLEGSRWY